MNYMTESSLLLIDSNILIYAFDTDETTKNPAAEKLFEDIATGKIKIALSVQNLSEFYFNATKKYLLRFQLKQPKMLYNL